MRLLSVYQTGCGCAIALGILLFPFAVSTSGFGLNKVQYDRFRWSYYQSQHFNVYYTQGGDSVADFAAQHVEEMYQDISKTLGHKLTSRIPIILHNTHTEFEQTNVIRMPLHESIGGFTESFKNRIVLPFEGDYNEFYHVLKHELVHAMVNNFLMGDSPGSSISRQGAFHFPLWVNEGLSEYLSLGWDLSSEFFMIDATTSGYVASPVNNFGGYLAYKGGQMFFHFLEEVYGKGTIKKFIRTLKSSRNMNRAFKEVTNTSLEEAGEIWLRELRYIYWPELGKRQHGKQVARKLTNHGKDLSNYNFQPAISPDKKEIAFFSDRKLREGIFILNLETEKVSHAVLQGGVKGKHESFHSYKSGLSWGPKSKRLAIVSKNGGKDVIDIIDAKSGKVLEMIDPDVQAILSPNWSRDGKKICFSGIMEGYSDIYIWDRDSKKLSRLLHDKAYDGKPCFSPSGQWIAFESNRKSLKGDKFGNDLDIFKIRTDGSALVNLSSTIYDEEMPSYGHADSLIIFVSNRSGINNLYLNSQTDSGFTENPISNVMAGCFTPSWSMDDSLLAFTIFEFGGWDIFLMKDPLTKLREKPLPKSHYIKTLEDSTIKFFRPLNWENLSSYEKDTTDSAGQADTKKERKKAKKEEKRKAALEKDSLKAVAAQKIQLDSAEYLDENGSFIKKNYTPILSLDVAAAELGASNFAGPLGGGVVVLSDLMGDQEIQIGLSLQGDIKNSQFELYYSYLPYRIDYMAGGFYRSYSDVYTLGGSELSWGFTGALIYPLSTFTRWQFNLNSLFIQRKSSGNNPQSKSSGIFSPTLFWSHDNTQWGYVGPINGERINARVSVSPPLFDDNLFFAVGDLDFRKYWEFFKKYTLAFRVNAGLSEKISGYRNPHQFWLGGDNFLVLYPFDPNSENIPEDTDLETLYFSEFALPLRGYRFFEFKGNRKILTNLEFRFPFINELIIAWPPPGLRFPPITGIFFADYGAAWSKGSEFEGNQGLGIGYGLRVNLGILVLRWTRAKPLEGIGNHKKSQTDYWSLGAEF